MQYQFTYLLMAVGFLIIWLSLFIWRKYTRKEMLIMSVIFGFAGPLGDIFYTQDWWKPLTITNTAIGPEAFLVGFLIGGIAAVIYEDVFKKKLKIRKKDKKIKERENLSLIIVLSLTAVIFLVSFYLLKTNSLLSTILAFIIPTTIMLIKRKDLIIDSVVTGFLLVMVAFLVYNFVEFLNPNWIQAFWHFKNVPNLVIFNVPIDDLIWYSLAGMYIAPLYEFWQEARLTNIKK